MTTSIKVASHNYPARVQTIDDGKITDSRLLKPDDGEIAFYCTTTRELRIVDVESAEHHYLGQTHGEKRVRLSFNPSDDSVVTQIKRKAAELIDLAEALKAKDPRLAALAATAFEEGAMWAVKAATA